LVESGHAIYTEPIDQSVSERTMKKGGNDASAGQPTLAPGGQHDGGKFGDRTFEPYRF
jgi:hypothetical protein